MCFEDEAGQPLRPPRGRTWGWRGRTPIVSPPVKGTGRVSIAGLIATRPDQPGARPRLIYRMRRHRGRTGERRGFAGSGSRTYWTIRSTSSASNPANALRIIAAQPGAADANAAEKP